MKTETKKSDSINPTEVCYRAFELMHAKQFDDAEKLLMNCLAKVEDDVPCALFHSTLGVLYKMRGEFKTAWRHYERAEKLIPNDPALKIIMARLLITEFLEFDQGIKKAKKVIELIPNNPVFCHQAYITMGLSFIGKGNKKKAIEMLNKSMEGAFEGFVTAANIDFNLCEKLLRKGWAQAEVKTFLDRALKFAETHKEEKWIETIRKMVASYAH